MGYRHFTQLAHACTANKNNALAPLHFSKNNILVPAYFVTLNPIENHLHKKEVPRCSQILHQGFVQFSANVTRQQGYDFLNMNQQAKRYGMRGALKQHQGKGGRMTQAMTLRRPEHGHWQTQQICILGCPDPYCHNSAYYTILYPLVLYPLVLY